MTPAKLASPIHAALTKGLGFRKKGATLRRSLDGTPLVGMLVVEVQGARGAAAVYVNVAAHYAPADGPDISAMHPHACLEWFRVKIAAGEDRWPNAHADPLVAAVQAQAGPWLEARTDPLKAFRSFEAALKDTWIQGANVEKVCRNWVALGEPDRAVDAFVRRLAYLRKERPRADPARVHEQAARLGLALPG